jgi:FixJ family two-component response regulator
MVDCQSDEIAVVDDDAAVLESFQFMLELAGFQVAAYSSAIAFLDSGRIRPCCLILDQHMPLMTGLELTARLRASAIDVPVLLVTGAPSPAIVARAAELGVEKVLEKPPTEGDLLSFVSMHTSGSAA